MKQKKLAISMRGGLARACGYLGVIKALEENNIRIDMIVGSSMGAIIGGVYASGKPLSEIYDLEDEIGIRKWIGWESIKDLSLLSDKKVIEHLGKIVGDMDISETKIPLWIQVTNTETQTLEYLDHGSLKVAMAASMAYPFFMQPIEFEGVTYMDGDITADFGVEFIKDKGAEVVIGMQPGYTEGDEELHSPISRLTSSLSIAGRRIRELEQQENPVDILFDDLGKDVGHFDLDRAMELADFGYAQAMERKEEIKSLVYKKGGLFSFFRK